MAPSSASVTPAATKTAKRLGVSQSPRAGSGTPEPSRRRSEGQQVRDREDGQHGPTTAGARRLRSCPAIFGGTRAVTVTAPVAPVLLDDAPGATQPGEDVAPLRRELAADPLQPGAQPAPRSPRARRGALHRYVPRSRSRRRRAGPPAPPAGSRSLLLRTSSRGRPSAPISAQHVLDDAHVLRPAGVATRRPRAAAGRRRAPPRACS